MADPPLPGKVSMSAAVDAVTAGGHGRRGNPSVVGTVANPVQMQAEKNLAVGLTVGVPDLSAVAVVVDSKMLLDPTVEATAVDAADASGAAATAVNGDGSDEVRVLLR